MRPTRRELLISLAATACVARAAPPPGVTTRISPACAPSVPAIDQWIRNSADSVSRWYGRFPVPNVRVEVGAGGGRGPHSGVTYGLDDPNIRIEVGPGTTQADLDEDWVLVHEMVHLAFPNVPRVHHWIEEGIATYVEPWARVEAGRLDVGTAWRDFVVGLPQGLPRPGDAGLDHTPTWARTYWGGALFCLLADLDALEKTAGKRRLKDALQAILTTTGGMVHDDLPLASVLATGDAALGVPVLVPLYDRMKADPHPVELEPIWTKLGVKVADRRCSFDDTASLAPLRRLIAVAPPPR